MAERAIIQIQNQNTKGITVRFSAEDVADMDKVVENINKLTNNNLSRNQLIELLYKNAKNEAKFEINAQQLSFEELLHLYDEYVDEDIPEDEMAIKDILKEYTRND